MKKKFITNLILLLILNLLVKPLWLFGITLKVQNLAGTSEYGFYFSLFSLSVLLNTILDAGLTNFNNRAVARNSKLVQTYFPNIVAIKILLAVVYFVICIVLSFALGYDHRQFSLLMVLCLNQFLSSFILYLRSNISGMQFFTTDSILSVLDRGLMIVLCSLLLFTNLTGGIFRIEWFAYVQTLSYSLTAIIIFIIFKLKSEKITFYFNLKHFYKILLASAPYAVLILLMACYNRIDSVMLERMLPDGREQAGIYAQAYLILDAVSMFGFLVAGLLLPMFARQLKKKENTGPLAELSLSLILVPAIALAFMMYIYKEPVMQLLFHTDASSGILAILLTGFIGICTSYIFGTLLTANGSLGALNYMALAGVLLNVILNFILIPRYGAIGCAFSSLATQLLTALIQLVLAIRITGIKLHRLLALRLLVYTALSFSVMIIVRSLKLQLFAGMCCMIAICLAAALLTRLINIREIKNTLLQTAE